jgi:hypothetical protein
MSEYDFTKQLAGRSQHEVARSVGQDAGPLTLAVAAEALPVLVNPIAGPRAISDAGVREDSWDDVQRLKVRLERQRIIPLPDPLLAIDQQPIVARQRYFESLLGIRDGQDRVAIYNIKTTFLFDMLTFRRIAELIEWRRFMYRAFFVIHTNFEARLAATDINAGEMEKMLALNGHALDLTLPSRYGEVEQRYKAMVDAKTELKEEGPPGSWKSYPNLAATILTDAGGAPPETADGKYKHVRPVFQHVADGFTAFAQRNRTTNTPADHLFDRAVNPTDDKLCGGVFDIMEELQRPESTPALDATCANLMGHSFESVDLFSTYLMRRSELKDIVVFPKLAKPSFHSSKEKAVSVQYAHHDSSILATDGFEKNIPLQGPEHVLTAAEFSLRDFFNLCARSDAVRFADDSKQLGQSDLVAVLQFYLQRFNGDATKAYAMFLFWLELRLLAIFLVQFCFPCVDEMTRHTTKAESGGFPFEPKTVRGTGKEEEVSQWDEKEWKLKFHFPIPYAQDPLPDSKSKTPAGFPSWCLAMYRERSKASPAAAEAELLLDAKCAEIVSVSALKAWNQPNAPLESMWAPYSDLETLRPEAITEVRNSIGRKFMMPFMCWPLERICDPLSIKPRTDAGLELGGGDQFARRLIPAFMHCLKQRLEFHGLQESVRELLVRLHGIGDGWTLEALVALRQALRMEHDLPVPAPALQLAAPVAATSAAAAVSTKPKRAEKKAIVNMTDEISESEVAEKAPSSEEEEGSAAESNDEETPNSKRHKNSKAQVTPPKPVAKRSSGRRGPEPLTTPLLKGAPATAAASSGSNTAAAAGEEEEDDDAMSDGENKPSGPTPKKGRASGKLPAAAFAPATMLDERARMYPGVLKRNTEPKEEEEDEEEAASKSKQAAREAAKRPQKKFIGGRGAASNAEEEDEEESGHEEEEAEGSDGGEQSDADEEEEEAIVSKPRRGGKPKSIEHESESDAEDEDEPLESSPAAAAAAADAVVVSTPELKKAMEAAEKGYLALWKKKKWIMFLAHWSSTLARFSDTKKNVLKAGSLKAIQETVPASSLPESIRQALESAKVSLGSQHAGATQFAQIVAFVARKAGQNTPTKQEVQRVNKFLVEGGAKPVQNPWQLCKETPNNKEARKIVKALRAERLLPTYYARLLDQPLLPLWAAVAKVMAPALGVSFNAASATLRNSWESILVYCILASGDSKRLPADCRFHLAPPPASIWNEGDVGFLGGSTTANAYASKSRPCMTVAQILSDLLVHFIQPGILLADS